MAVIKTLTGIGLILFIIGMTFEDLSMSRSWSMKVEDAFFYMMAAGGIFLAFGIAGLIWV